MPSGSGRPVLYLVDGTSNIYRAFHALRGGFSASDGTPTNAAYGFTNMLRKLLREEQPDYIGICFDKGRPAYRLEEFPEYKANRPPPPDELRQQIPLVHDITRAYNIPSIIVEGWEADDVIATLARQAATGGFDVVVVASDKDLFQLVDDRIRVLNPHKDNLLMDAAVVKEVFGVRPDQVVDVLALIGDASDNIPGVPGIGEKGARKLLEEYETLDALLENAAGVKRKSYRENLQQHADQARLSRRLITLRMDAPVEFKQEELARRDPDVGELREIFRKLEFRSFLVELEPDAPRLETRYRTVASADDLKAFIEEIRQAGRVSVDLETTGKDAMRAEILGVALSVKPAEAVYVPVRHQQGSPELLPPEVALPLLQPVLEDTAIRKIAQNAKYEWLCFRRAGIELQGIAFDTMVAAYLVNPAGSHKLDDLAMAYLDHKMIPYTDLAGKGAKQVTLDLVELERVVEYACEDADITLRLADLLEPALESAGLSPLFEKVEMPLLPVLARMEYAGVRVDPDHLGTMSRQMEKDLSAVEKRIHAAAGREFNINSPQQLGEILFSELGLKPKRKTAKTKAFSTSQQVLEELAEDHPVCALVLEWRSLSKLKSTYVDALPGLIHPQTGRVHASFNQTVAATGRLSSSDPNLQNIPVRTVVGREIRRAFIPADGSVLLTADYSQVELRVLAHLTGDPVLSDAFRRGEDIHARTAAEIFGINLDLVSEEMRRRAKVINFGILYGMGPHRLAREQGISMKQAQEFIRSYFERFSSVKDYIDRTVETAESEGRVTTLMERVRHFPELRSKNRMAREQAKRAAVNTTIQGTAADIIKVAMLRIDEDLRRAHPGSRMIIQVHDELIFEVPEGEIEEVSALVRTRMEGACALDVPLTVDLGWGPSWLEAKGSS